MRAPPTLTPDQLSVLAYADAREAGQIWTANRSVAEDCCDHGWLSAGHIIGMDANDPESVVYDLTRTGRELVAGKAG